MRNLLSPELLVKPPSSIIAYFDRIVIWLRIPVDGRTLKKLRHHCGHLQPGRRIARWDRNFKQRLDFKQPDEEALRWIAGRNDGLINYGEVTLDLIFRSRAESVAARDYLYRHLTRRWHRGQEIVFYDNDEDSTRYDGPRTAPNVIAIYLEDYSRITGECYCLHVEWKMRGVDAVRAAGILRPRHLLTFDHRAFWRERMRLYTVDPGRLGRLFRNREEITHSHRITPADSVTGRTAIAPYQTVQMLIDHFAPYRIGRVLTPLSSRPFLPPRLILLYTNPNYPNSDRTDYRTSDRTTKPLVTISPPLARKALRPPLVTVTRVTGTRRMKPRLKPLV
jgi:hypothetical protein